MNEDKLFVGFCWYSLCCLDYKIIHLPVIRRRETPAENYYQWTFLVLLLQEKLKRKHWNTKATKNTIKASHESKVTKHSSLQLFFSHHDQDVLHIHQDRKYDAFPQRKCDTIREFHLEKHEQLFIFASLDSPSPVSISSALPYLGVCLWAAVPAPGALSTWMASVAVVLAVLLV